MSRLAIPNLDATQPTTPSAEPPACVRLSFLSEDVRSRTVQAGLSDPLPSLAAKFVEWARAQVSAAAPATFRPERRLSDEWQVRDLDDCDREVAGRCVGVEDAERELNDARRAHEAMESPSWWTHLRLLVGILLVAAAGTVALGGLLVESMDLYVLQPYWLEKLRNREAALAASRQGAFWLSHGIAAAFLVTPCLLALCVGRLSRLAKATIFALEVLFAAAFVAMRLRTDMTWSLWGWGGFELSVAAVTMLAAFVFAEAIAGVQDASSRVRTARRVVEGCERRLEEAERRREEARTRREAVRRPIATREQDEATRPPLVELAERTAALEHELATAEVSLARLQAIERQLEAAVVPSRSSN